MPKPPRARTIGLGCLLLALVVAVWGAGDAPAQEGGDKRVPSKLWKTYPLEPDSAKRLQDADPPAATTEGPAEIPPADERPASERRTEGGGEERDASASDGPAGLPALAVLGIALGALTVVALAAATVGRERPAFVNRVRIDDRRPRLHQARPQRQGGPQMSNFMRRFREGNASSRGEAASSSPNEAREASAGAAKPLSLETSTSTEAEMQQSAQDRADPRERKPPEAVASAGQLGEHVTAVVSTAQLAAERIRSEAVAEADQIRTAARDEAKALIVKATHEAERMRSDAAAYTREARQDADAYAGEKRSEADAYASRIRAKAEENARDVRASATQEAMRIEKDAVQRSELLIAQAQRFERRVVNLHSIFQEITKQLEGLLPDTSKAEDDDPKPNSIDDSLRSEAQKTVSGQ